MQLEHGSGICMNTLQTSPRSFSVMLRVRLDDHTAGICHAAELIAGEARSHKLIES